MRATALIVLLAACDAVLGLDPIPPPHLWRKKLTVTQNTDVALQDFVLSVVWDNDPDLAAHAADQRAIKFLDNNGMLLSVEIVSFDQMTGALDAWVHVPALPPGDSVLWIVYSDQDFPAATSPWTGPFAAVWHEARGDGSELDRGPNGHDLQAMSAQVPSSVPGIVGNARMYNSTAEPMCDGHINSTLDFGTNAFSYSVWVDVPALPTTSEFVLNKGGSSLNDPGYDIELAVVTSEQINDATSGHATATVGTVPTNQWAQLALVVDRAAGVAYAYLDGAQAGMKSLGALGSVSSLTPLCLGANANGGRPLLGALDEPRIYNIAVPPEWFRFEYQNLTARDRVIAVGPEQPR